MSTQMVKRLKAKSGGNGSPPPPLAGLRFAVYARKSNEDARTEDHKSTGRQIENARRYVEARGGEVLADHVYTDEEISGAEFRNRAGLLRLLTAVENGRPFSGLVMMEKSRLGRESIETQWTLKKFTDSGVRVFFYQTDEEAKLDSALDKVMASLNSFADEMEREKARLRCREAAERKARQGHVAGGACYAYENVRMKGDRPAEPGEKHDYVLRRINPEEAAIVRGIFQAYADGIGMVRIAKALNGDPGQAAVTRQYFGGRKLPPPRGRADGWAPTLIRHMLWRPIYKGEVVWGKMTHVDRNGRASLCIKQAERDWLRQPAPDLRIIEDDLWTAVHARLKAQAGMYLRDHRGKLWGQADRGKEGHYLLSGLGRCRACGSRINVLGGNPRRYGCTGASWKGTCSDGWTKQVAPTDAAFLAALEREVLTPAVFNRAVQEAVRLVHEELAKEPERVPTLERERADLARKIARLVKVVEDGNDSSAIRAAITGHEIRVTEIQAELARLAAGPPLAPSDLLTLEAEAAVHLRRFADLLQGDVPLARQLLKKLLAEPIAFWTAAAGRKEKAIHFSAKLSYGAVLRECICGEKPR